MSSVWFIVPAHRRFAVTRACLRQLERTCFELVRERGIAAHAIVIAEDANLDIAAGLGFGTIERANKPLGRKWNDGYEVAGKQGVDYVVPLGSDDWVDPLWVLAQLAADGELRCSRRSAVVSEDGLRLARLEIRYPGAADFGDGVRMIPVALLKPLRYRPADEDATRAIDTRVFQNVRRALNRTPRVSFTEVHPLQIVDFKTAGSEQLNPYEGCLKFADGLETDPWAELAGCYPSEAIDEMRAVYGADVKAAA
jgi:hypothetical protein